MFEGDNTSIVIQSPCYSASKTLEYKGDQLNAAPLLEVENFTNWKKRFICRIISIEPQFENIIKVVPISPWQLVKGSLKYNGQQMRESIYDNENKKALTTVTPLSTAVISTSIIQDFQNSPDDKEDTRSNQEYLNDLKEEYQARVLLAKSKRFFKKGSQRFSGPKATEDTQCHKCGRNGHFARDCFSKTSVPSFPLLNQNKTQPRLTSSSHHKTESKDFEAKYNKVKAKLAILSLEDVSSDDNEVMEVKALMAFAEEEEFLLAKNVQEMRNGFRSL
ncbi:retrovirus-related pol polyprotein from transposon TNT 1-94 [Tanacetum coccineum]|uniref:Retrovirus-related pol polyprotein from transposon TNT 1-94 n=1 Tax=Tanacetum coccineum TaxID=301880 RepID=A0ABQ5D4U5_9ASTR